MKIIATLSLAALVLLGLGCSSDKTTAPISGETLNYDVTGSDAPASMEIAIQELSDLSISVPDPVPANDPVLAQETSIDEATTVINTATLDDSARANFRRIVAHLQDQFQMLRRCMSTNSDPRLRRLAYGAHVAYAHGMRALQANEPRLALRYFYEANRILNLAIRLCSSRG